MIVDNVRYVELSVLSDPVGGGYGYEVGWLGQAVHDDPYLVMRTWDARQTHNKVHTYVFPFPLRVAEGL
jgi:hypothetical protein